MNQSRRQFAATLLAGGVSLFLPKTIAPVRWKVKPSRFMSADMVDGMRRTMNVAPVGAVLMRAHEGRLQWVVSVGDRFEPFDWGKVKSVGIQGGGGWSNL